MAQPRRVEPPAAVAHGGRIVAIGRVDKAMATKALSGVTIDSTRKAMLKEAGGSGIKLLQQFGAYLVKADHDPTYDNCMRYYCEAHMEEGPL